MYLRSDAYVYLGGQVQQRLQLANAGIVFDSEPGKERSPSPEPVYDDKGVRTNKREHRLRDKLTKEKAVGR